MIISSNRAFAEWPERFGEPLLASAALGRLGHDAHPRVLTGASDRNARTRAAEKKVQPRPPEPLHGRFR